MTVAQRNDLDRFIRNYRDEVDGVALYRALARAEKDERLRGIYERLAQSEEKHLDLWRSKIVEAGGTLPDDRPSTRVRLIGAVAKRFGPGSVAPLVARMEQAAFTMYDDQPDASAAGLPRAERGHALISRELARGGMRANDIARIEGRHLSGSGNALRAAILGAQDGLVSNLCLVMGFAGADPGRSTVIFAGLSGLLAGSLSMGLGEWVSVRSAGEAFERQVRIERDEIAMMPAEEAEELALIYEAKGLNPQDARRMAERIVSDPEIALDTLTREELGMSADEVGSAWTAAFTSSALFALGALIPILPWIIAGGFFGAIASAIVGGFGLFLLGAGSSLFTGRSPQFAGSRMLVIGLAAAAATFGIGLLWGTQA